MTGTSLALGRTTTEFAVSNNAVVQLSIPLSNVSGTNAALRKTGGAIYPMSALTENVEFFLVAAIVIFGSLGATLGAMVGYAIGRYVGLPVILRFGKYILITPRRLEKADVFAQKYGAWGVLIGRLIPIIPFKVFSIASGITRIPFIPVVVCTFIGVVPRMYLLGLFGVLLMKFTKICVILAAVAALLYLAVWAVRKYILKVK